MKKTIDQEEMDYITQDIKDDISNGTTIRDYPPTRLQDHKTNFGRIIIDIPLRGIEFKFSDMLPYIEEASDRLEEYKINMVDITIRFTDEEATKITSKEFYDIMNNNYSRKKRGDEFFKLIAISNDLKNLIYSIDKNNNLERIVIKYEYVYGDIISDKRSIIKKFKDYFDFDKRFPKNIDI